MAELDFEVVELDETDHPAEGDEAPDFTRPLVDSEQWHDVALSELLDEGPVVLVFHSMDGAFPASWAAPTSWPPTCRRRTPSWHLSRSG